MPRYFFNLSNETISTDDLVGLDLPDVELAKAEGKRLAAEIGTDQAFIGKLPEYEWLEVVDDTQRPVIRVPVARAVKEPNRI